MNAKKWVLSLPVIALILAVLEGGFAARVARLATPTRRMRSSGCLRKSGVAGGLAAPTESVLFILLYVLKSNLSY